MSAIYATKNLARNRHNPRPRPTGKGPACDRRIVMPGLGNITTEHTVWCATCEEWETFCDHTIKMTMESAKYNGWKKIKGFWICRRCVAKAKE